MTPRDNEKLEQLLGGLPSARPTPRDVRRVRDSIAKSASPNVESSAQADRTFARQPLWQKRITIPQAIAACLIVCVGSVLITIMLVSTPKVEDNADQSPRNPTLRHPIAPPVSNGSPQLVIQTDFFARQQPEPTPRHIGIRQWSTGGGQ